MSGEEFLLKWNDHHNSFFSIMQDLCSSETLTDVTLACGGQLFEAHKIILCVCSSFFRSILARPTRADRGNQHPIVFLKDVQPQHLDQLLQYMYHGEINVLQEDLAPLIEAARALKVKGLSDAPAGPKPPNNPLRQQQQQQRPKPPPVLSQPPPMKKARTLNQILNNQKRKAESPLNHLKPSNNLPPSFSLPTEPDPPESLKDEQLHHQQQQQQELWNSQSDPDASQQSGGSDYEINQEMYQDGDGNEEEQMYQGSQSFGGVQQQQTLPEAAAAAAADQNNLTAPAAAGGGAAAAGGGGKESRLRYFCNECGKGFITPSKLQRHSYSHTGLRPFVCDVCGKSFSQSANLKTHVKNTHAELLQYGDKNLLDVLTKGNGQANNSEDLPSPLPPPKEESN